MRVGELLRPITAAMGQEPLKGDYIVSVLLTPVCPCQAYDRRHGREGGQHHGSGQERRDPTGACVFSKRGK
jgi:hypothetical protein